MNYDESAAIFKETVNEINDNCIESFSKCISEDCSSIKSTIFESAAKKCLNKLDFSALNRLKTRAEHLMQQSDRRNDIY